MITNNLGKLAAASRVTSTSSSSSHLCFISHRGHVGAVSNPNIRLLTSSSSSSRQSQQKKNIGKQRSQRTETNMQNKYKPMHRESARKHSFPHLATQISDEKDNNDSNKYSNSLSKKGDFEKKTSTTSFFDAVDARMKELQKEQRKNRKQKQQNPKSSTQSKSVLDSFSFALNDSSNMNNSNKKKLRSIFDIFPLESDDSDSDKHESSLEKDCKDSNSMESNINSNAFDTSLFEVYEAAMKEIINSPRFTNKKDKQPDIEVVVQYLLDNNKKNPIHLPTLQTSNSSSSSTQSPSDDKKLKDQFNKELEQQRQQFITNTNMTQTQYQLALRGFCVLGDFCAKRSMANPLYIAWEKIKEAGMIPREQSMNTFLYAVSVGESMITTTDSHSSSITSPFKSSIFSLSNTTNDSTEDEDSLDAPSEIAIFHDIMYKPTEKSVSLRVKRLVAKGKFADAEAMLETPIYEKSKKKQPSSNTADTENLLKLRTYFPILRGYCEQGDCEAALKLFKRMKQSPSVQLESENHVLVIATLATNGYFRHNTKPLECAIDLGYSVGNGPVLFDELTQEMADDVLEITSASARRLSKAFESAHTINNPDPNIPCDTIPNAMHDDNEMTNDDEEDYLLRALPSLVAMPRNNETAAAHTLVVSRIAIDENTAVCPRTKARLRLIMLEEHQKQEFHDALIRLSSEQFQTFVTSNANFDPSLNEDDDYPKEQLNKFADWLATREGEPFTAIIDGANVAYYGQNFERGKFNYHQIKFLVDALESKNENVLVTVPHKYTRKVFYSNHGPQSKRTILSEAELDILNGLNETGKLYRVPARCLDDYYWMLASVSDQTVSRKGQDLTVPPNEKNTEDEKSQRWPGTRPMLLSNDQMRDHKLELLAPRLFRRWTSSHIVNYNFTALVDSECIDKEIRFSVPDFFSREIQGNPSGDGGGMAWHFPVSDWDINERFCIRIPNGPKL